MTLLVNGPYDDTGHEESGHPERPDRLSAAREGVADLHLGALAEPDREDDGGDPDQDAQHREQRAQAVRADILAEGIAHLRREGCQQIIDQGRIIDHA